MATKRDLVEAHAFSRRRLVTAFVSGAPGGREVEPARPGRTIVGGVALSVLLIAGAAITGIFTSTAPNDWDNPGLVLSKQLGAPYVIVDDGDDPEVHPVINITSAQLILGADNMEPRIVSQSVIDTQPLGDDIGILDAPNVMPQASQLIQTGWTSCAAPGGGLRTVVARSVGATTSSTTVPSTNAFVISTVVGGRRSYWLVAESPSQDGTSAQAYRYQLPKSRGQSDAILAGLGLDPTAAALRVPIEWLDLFPEGGALDVAKFGLTGFGDPAPGGARVGQYLPDPVTTGAGWVFGANGPIQLTPFAFQVYVHSRLPNGSTPKASSLGSLPDVTQVPATTYADAHWPQATLQRSPGEACAVLDASADRDPRVRIGTSPTSSASAAELGRDVRSVSVARGGGAYVVSGDAGSDSAWAIDSKGRANVLVGDDTAGLLGWSDPSVVGGAWIKLFRPGVALSRALALCPPATTSGNEQTCS